MAEYIEKNVAIARLTALEIGNPCATMTDAKRQISDTRPADVAPVVHGRWQPVRESEMTGWQPELAGYDPIGGYICSACKEETVYDCNDNFVLSNYCPNCGAKMDGGGGDAAD